MSKLTPQSMIAAASFAALFLSIAATPAAAQGIPAVGFAQVPAGTIIQTINQGGIPNIRNDCCGDLAYRSAQMIPPPLIAGQRNIFDQPLAYTMRIVSESRGFGIQEVEDVNDNGTYNGQRFVVIFAGSWNAAFNAWAPGGDYASNFIQYFCCVPDSGTNISHTVQVHYNMYDYTENQVLVDGSPIYWVGTGGNFTGGFQPDLRNMPFYVNMESPEVWGYGIYQPATGFDGVQQYLIWFSYDTGLPVMTVVSSSGDTNTFYTNYGSGGNLHKNQLWEGLGIYGGFPPYDATMPPGP